MKNKTKRVQQAEENNALRNRVVEAKKKLPSFGVSTLFVEKFPEYDTYKKRARVQNVLSYRVMDEDITSKLEQLATAMTVALHTANK